MPFSDLPPYQGHGSRVTSRKHVHDVVLSLTDMARIRFAHSPVRELVASVRVLHEARRRHPFVPWLRSVDPRQCLERWPLLTTVVTDPAWSWRTAKISFLTPFPCRPWPTIDDELSALATTPCGLIREQIEQSFPAGSIPRPWRRVHADPVGFTGELVEQMATYWDYAIEAIWARLRALCAADVSYRMEQFATGGLARLLDDLHPDVRLLRDRLRISRPGSVTGKLEARGGGILLIPCFFAWPGLNAGCDDAGRITVSYPPRGVGGLYALPDTDHAQSLDALLGRTRAALLTTLVLPATTTDLAAQLDVSPAAVSQHLRILKSARLVEGHRRGRSVLYQRTPMASSLLSGRDGRDSGADHHRRDVHDGRDSQTGGTSRGGHNGRDDDDDVHRVSACLVGRRRRLPPRIWSPPSPPVYALRRGYHGGNRSATPRAVRGPATPMGVLAHSRHGGGGRLCGGGDRHCCYRGVQRRGGHRCRARVAAGDAAHRDFPMVGPMGAGARP
ncbi:ArsR/SmtB family transcription factor [Phytoactinopolyspora limicola]|uniref:ArsR/SmtB family transcription factor n=1 Tax=Phytoactinopolyspora limicola TaxID=2715536 RepID=UPI001407EBE2|nr:DUF5937 family protein [Phytoactinopolyspora limicola]